MNLQFTLPLETRPWEVQALRTCAAPQKVSFQKESYSKPNQRDSGTFSAGKAFNYDAKKHYTNI